VSTSGGSFTEAVRQELSGVPLGATGAVQQELAGLLRTSEADSMEDFRGVYEFDEAFDSLPAPAGDCAARGSTCSDGRGTGDVG